MDENPITPDPNAPHPIDLGALNATNAPVVPMAPPVMPVDPMAAPPASMPSGMPDLGAPVDPMSSPMTPTPGGSKIKMYIIIAVAVVALGGIGFAAYSFFFTDAENATEVEDPASPNSLTNSLSDNPPPEDSADMEEMADIVDELKDVYPNESPPSLTLDASDMSSSSDTEADVEDASAVEESAATEETTPKKIAR